MTRAEWYDYCKLLRPDWDEAEFEKAYSRWEKQKERLAIERPVQVQDNERKGYDW